jgi:hypothetical protein
MSETETARSAEGQPIRVCLRCGEAMSAHREVNGIRSGPNGCLAAVPGTLARLDVEDELVPLFVARGRDGGRKRDLHGVDPSLVRQ